MRYWWVLVKFAVTTIGTVVVLRHTEAITHMSSLAQDDALATGDFLILRIQLVVHAFGGLIVLLAATVPSVYKPWGLTAYGRRKGT